MEGIANNKLFLKQAGKLTGYAPDYIGFLIRKKRIRGKKVPILASWQVPRQEIIKYCENKKNLENRDSSFLYDSPHRWVPGIFRRAKNLDREYLTLKEASKLTGYASDYIGWLIRRGKIKGKKIYNTSWITNEDTIKYYRVIKNRKKSLAQILFYFFKNNFNFSLGSFTLQIDIYYTGIFNFQRIDYLRIRAKKSPSDR